MLQNNGLQGTSANLTAWGSVGDATIAVDSENPLTTAIPHTLRLDVADGTTGTVGVTNAGYWGIPVDGSEHQTYFWIKGDLNGNITASLVGNGTGKVYGSTSIPVTSTSNKFTYIDASLSTTKAPDGDVYFELSLDGSEVAGSSLYFGLVQLFPTTYKNRYVISSRRLDIDINVLSIATTVFSPESPMFWSLSKPPSCDSLAVTICE